MPDEEVTSHIDLKEAIDFIISNAGKSPRNVNRPKLKEYVCHVYESSLHGLPTAVIRTLCQKVIFKNYYDIATRRKLLYSCIPVTSDFPYEIIPLAISSATAPNQSSTWQTSIVVWLYGLLQFHVIDGSHKMVHLCYQPLFNLLNNLKTCGFVTMVLYHITRREDVTAYRVQIILRLRRKIGYAHVLTHLLSVYQVLRPDLIVSRLDQAKRVPEISKMLKEPLARALQRLEEQSQQAQDAHLLWPGVGLRRRANPFHDPTVLPLPEVLVYADTLERKKEKIVSVLQYKRVKEMVSQMHEWQLWRWPTAASALLWKPLTLALFRPHDPRLKVAVSNWLECALKAEVIEQLGSPSRERQEHLLDTCLALVRDTETLVPAVFHFMIGFFTKWDRYSHMPRVLALVSFVPYVSPSLFCESVFETFSQIMATASLALVCAIINVFSNTAMTWALQARREGQTIFKGTHWPYDLADVFPLEGVLFLSQRLGRVFAAAVLRFGPHPLLVNTCISYYTKVNMCLEELRLPVFVAVPCELFFAALTSSNVVATHRLGHQLVSVLERSEQVKKRNVSGDLQLIKNSSLFQIQNINFCAIIYLDSVITNRGFSERWTHILSSFVNQSSLRTAMALENMKYFSSVFRSLPYLPLAAKYSIDAEQDYTKDKSQMNEIGMCLLDDLVKANLDGIRVCTSVYIR